MTPLTAEQLQWLGELLVFQFSTMFEAGMLWAVCLGFIVWLFHGAAICFTESPWGTRYRLWVRASFRRARRRLEEGKP
jgi:hypothetical protein